MMRQPQIGQTTTCSTLAGAAPLTILPLRIAWTAAMSRL